MIKKVFISLGTVVGCIVVIAFVLNIIMPNAVNGVVNTVESGIYSATGVELDFNGDGAGDKSSSGTVNGTGDAAMDGVGVEGFQ